jgi:hypothetical protein
MFSLKVLTFKSANQSRQSQYVNLTCPFWSDKVEILDVLPEGLDVLVYGVGGHAANLHQPIVLDEYCVAGQVPYTHQKKDTFQSFKQLFKGIVSRETCIN